jgi:hypothetical protein
MGRCLCVADKENYNMINLGEASLFPVLPISQAPNAGPIKPLITVISENEFLIVSWTGASALGVFITGDGDPVRGTLEWPSYPEAMCMHHFILHTSTCLTLLASTRLPLHNNSAPKQDDRNTQHRVAGNCTSSLLARRA